MNCFFSYVQWKQWMPIALADDGVQRRKPGVIVVAVPTQKRSVHFGELHDDKIVVCI